MEGLFFIVIGLVLASVIEIVRRSRLAGEGWQELARRQNAELRRGPHGLPELVLPQGPGDPYCEIGWSLGEPMSEPHTEFVWRLEGGALPSLALSMSPDDRAERKGLVTLEQHAGSDEILRLAMDHDVDASLNAIHDLEPSTTTELEVAGDTIVLRKFSKLDDLDDLSTMLRSAQSIAASLAERLG